MKSHLKMDAATYRQLQLDRITGNTGTSELEIQLVTSISLVRIFFHLIHTPKFTSTHFFVDFLFCTSRGKIMLDLVSMVAICG